jgi:hypothetical protein
VQDGERSDLRSVGDQVLELQFSGPASEPATWKIAIPLGDVRPLVEVRDHEVHVAVHDYLDFAHPALLVHDPTADEVGTSSEYGPVLRSIHISVE